MRRYADDPLIWMIVGGIGLGVFGIVNSTSGIELLFWVLGGMAVALVAFLFYLDPQPHKRSIFTTARPPAIRAHARRRFARAPWVPVLDSPNELVFWRRLHPNLLVVLILYGLFGPLPPIVYVVIALRSTQTVWVTTLPANGSTNVTVWARPRSHDGRRIANRLLNDIIDLGGSSASRPAASEPGYDAASNDEDRAE